MEWLTLLLLVPAIVLPMVLLFGFAGCSFEGFPPEVVFEQTFAATFTNVDDRRGHCLVQRIEPLRLFLSGSQVRITLQAFAESVVIDRILISQPAATGNPYDSADDLSNVTGVIRVPPNRSWTLPPVSYSLDRTRPLLIAMDISNNSGDLPFVEGVPATDAVAFYKLGAEAATKDRQPDYTVRYGIYLIEKIEVA